MLDILDLQSKVVVNQQAKYIGLAFQANKSFLILLKLVDLWAPRDGALTGPGHRAIRSQDLQKSCSPPTRECQACQIAPSFSLVQPP